MHVAKYGFMGKGIYRSYDKVVSEFGFLSIEVIKMQKQDDIQHPRYADIKISAKVFDQRKMGGEEENVRQARAC